MLNVPEAGFLDVGSLHLDVVMMIKGVTSPGSSAGEKGADIRGVRRHVDEV